MSATLASVLTPVSVEQSYRFCISVARKRARNFYYSFLLLDRPRRDAMCAIYAFMRECDDLADDPGVDCSKMAQNLATWRMEMNHALHGDFGPSPIWPAFHDTVTRYAIPHRFFNEMIDGVTSDLEPRDIQTYDDLYRYSYLVASVVGMTVVHIFGFESVKALLLAEKCGIAFQLTNVMRDVREDARVDRFYLPREDREAFGVSNEQLRTGKEDRRFRDMMRFEAGRARALYLASAGLNSLLDRKTRRSMWALRAVYLELLSRIEKSNYSVLSRSINVPMSAKLGLLARALLSDK